MQTVGQGTPGAPGAPGRVLAAFALLALASCADTRFPVDGARAHARVVFQVDAGPRIPGTEGHVRVRAWLEHELARLGGRVELQRFTDTTLGRPLELTNVIARWEPERPSPDGRGPLVLCAHYDTRPWSDEETDTAFHGEPVPGANDGGSGVAVLLEVAEILSRRAPPCAVNLVFFDGEDMGRAESLHEFSLGARGYAARLETPLPRAAFLFDMVGDRDLAIHPEATGAERASNIAQLVYEAARATGGGHFHPEPRYRLSDDHVPLLDRGVPAVDVIDFDYPAWHTRRDLPDQVSPESLAEVARVAAWLVYRSPLGALR